MLIFSIRSIYSSMDRFAAFQTTKSSMARSACCYSGCQRAGFLCPENCLPTDRLPRPFNAQVPLLIVSRIELDHETRARRVRWRDRSRRAAPTSSQLTKRSDQQTDQPRCRKQPLSRRITGQCRAAAECLGCADFSVAIAETHAWRLTERMEPSKHCTSVLTSSQMLSRGHARHCGAAGPCSTWAHTALPPCLRPPLTRAPHPLKTCFKSMQLCLEQRSAKSRVSQSEWSGARSAG